MKAFDVEEVPVNFLIGREGKILGFELEGPGLASAVEKALGGRSRVAIGEFENHPAKSRRDEVGASPLRTPPTNLEEPATESGGFTSDREG